MHTYLICTHLSYRKWKHGKNKALYAVRSWPSSQVLSCCAWTHIHTHNLLSLESCYSTGLKVVLDTRLSHNSFGGYIFKCVCFYILFWENKIRSSGAMEHLFYFWSSELVTQNVSLCLKLSICLKPLLLHCLIT